MEPLAGAARGEHSWPRRIHNGNNANTKEDSMNYLKMLKKGFLGFFTGLAAVIVLGIVQSISSYNPVVCSETVVDNCTSQFVISAYQAIIPIVTAFLVGIANWLKHKSD